MAIRICDHPHEAFLVHDESLGDSNAPFYKWLRSLGYEFAGHHGNFGSTWAYVDISNKEFAYGMPSIAFMAAIGNHAITMDEFLTIYKIYEKYEGKPPLVFDTNS